MPSPTRNQCRKGNHVKNDVSVQKTENPMKDVWAGGGVQGSERIQDVDDDDYRRDRTERFSEPFGFILGITGIIMVMPVDTQQFEKA